MTTHYSAFMYPAADAGADAADGATGGDGASGMDAQAPDADGGTADGALVHATAMEDGATGGDGASATDARAFADAQTAADAEEPMDAPSGATGKSGGGGGGCSVISQGPRHVDAYGGVLISLALVLGHRGRRRSRAR